MEIKDEIKKKVEAEIEAEEAYELFKKFEDEMVIESTVATSTPKKRGNNNSGEEGPVTKEKNDPIVAFSRPPPLPPVLGPLVALSLLETWSSRDSNDD
ncbi:hypothetical protein CFP56_033175 [Quercus suber]|uniref:Uncharacterized protein n=1 Tax=Quercus suber TaxID=58331 RepID=A0AAW0MBS2_QUESU